VEPVASLYSSVIGDVSQIGRAPDPGVGDDVTNILGQKPKDYPTFSDKPGSRPIADQENDLQEAVNHTLLELANDGGDGQKL
jgi:hypothetical protein